MTVAMNATAVREVSTEAAAQDFMLRDLRSRGTSLIRQTRTNKETKMYSIKIKATFTAEDSMTPAMDLQDSMDDRLCARAPDP